LRAEYTVQHLDVLDAKRYDPDPNEPPPNLPRSFTDSHLSASITFSSVQRQPFDISTSYGQFISLWAAYAEPYLGATARAVSLGGRAEQFVRFAFRESVLAFAYTAQWHGATALGGYPADTRPVLDTIVQGRSAPGDYARLRGFGVRKGDQLQALQGEYRFLITRINRGLSTLPIFARRIHAALFCDAGDAFAGRFSLRRVGVGVGAELRFDWAGGLAYAANYTLRGGIAQGLTTGGVFQWYLTLAVPF
jgi:hypothetical protein